MEEITPVFTPLLTTTDWNQEWKQLQSLRRKKDDASFWDERAKTFATKDTPNPYVERFLELADIKPGETVFDMGCGTGALAIPLGAEGHKVVAADFSQGMLEHLQTELDARGIRTVFPKRMSWEDDWQSFGVRPGMTDVAIASRSIATSDLRASLLRLTDIARRRVCITLATAASPRMDEHILRALGVEVQLGRDYLYAFNILANEGLTPEVSYIHSERRETFDSPDEAFDNFARMVHDAFPLLNEVPDELDGMPLSPTQIKSLAAKRDQALDNLRPWLDANLVENERAGTLDKKGVPEKRLRLRQSRTITWAFMAWNK